MFTTEQCIQKELNRIKSIIKLQLDGSYVKTSEVVCRWKRQRNGKSRRFCTKAVFNPHSLGKGSINCVCASEFVCAWVSAGTGPDDPV